MKKQNFLIFISFFLFTLAAEVCVAQSKKISAESRLKELKISLTEPAAPTANFLKAVRIGNLVYLSGHGPDKPEGGQVIGKLGSDLTIEQGQEAARLVGISLLSSLKKKLEI